MKIGLKEERWGDEQLVEKLLDMMQQTGADFTSTFRQLAEVRLVLSDFGGIDLNLRDLVTKLEDVTDFNCYH